MTMSLMWRFVGSIAASFTFFIVLRVSSPLLTHLGLKLNFRTRWSLEWSLSARRSRWF